MFKSGKTSVRNTFTRHIARLMKVNLADTIDLDTSTGSLILVLLVSVQNVCVMQGTPELWLATREDVRASGEDATLCSLCARCRSTVVPENSVKRGVRG